MRSLTLSLVIQDLNLPRFLLASLVRRPVGISGTWKEFVLRFRKASNRRPILLLLVGKVLISRKKKRVSQGYGQLHSVAMLQLMVRLPLLQIAQAPNLISLVRLMVLSLGVIVLQLACKVKLLFRLVIRKKKIRRQKLIRIVAKTLVVGGFLRVIVVLTNPSSLFVGPPINRSSQQRKGLPFAGSGFPPRTTKNAPLPYRTRNNATPVKKDKQHGKAHRHKSKEINHKVRPRKGKSQKGHQKRIC